MNSTCRALLSLFIGILFSTGCAAIMSRNDWNGGRMLETPPFFTGVTMDTKAVGQSIAAPFDNNPKTDGWEFLSFPLYIIDLPFSLVADVVYIPADYKYQKR